MAPSESNPHAGRRRILVGVVLAFAGLLTFLAIFSFWVNRQALNTDNWVDTSSKLLENKQIQAQISTFLVNQLYANVDIEAELKQALPPRAKVLAGPAAGGLRQLAQRVSERALAMPQVQELWATANRAAHEQLLRVINGGGPVVSTGEGQVTLHLDALVAQVGSQVGVPADVLSKLPKNAGSLPVLNSKQLSTTQKVAKAIRGLPVVLTALLILLYGGAIALARGRRREVIRTSGLLFVAAGILVLLVRRIAGTNVVDSLAATATVRPAAEAAWDIGTSLLVTVAVSAIAFGILVLLGCWLAGRTRPAQAIRREAAPYFRERRAAVYGVAAAVWLMLILWAPIAAFDQPFGILLFAALFAVGTEVVRRQSLREFPEAPVGQLWHRTGEALRSISSGRTQRPSTDGEAVVARRAAQLDQLERLGALHREGVLTELEFEQQKRAVLADGASLGDGQARSAAR